MVHPRTPPGLSIRGTLSGSRRLARAPRRMGGFNQRPDRLERRHRQVVNAAETSLEERFHADGPVGWPPAPKDQAREWLVPAVRVLRETRTLHRNDAEALAGRSLHHHPTLEAFHHLGSQLSQARHFGSDVVRLDVDVDPALVLDALDLHESLVGRGGRHWAVTAAARMPR